jgi:hypothetical protein
VGVGEGKRTGEAKGVAGREGGRSAPGKQRRVVRMIPPASVGNLGEEGRDGEMRGGGEPCSKQQRRCREGRRGVTLEAKGVAAGDATCKKRSEGVMNGEMMGEGAHRGSGGGWCG